MDFSLCGARCSSALRMRTVARVQSSSDACALGILGGGQLGRMLCEAALPMGIKVAVLDPAQDCPARSVAYRHVVGDFRNAHSVKEFAKKCAVLTTELESAHAETLEELASQGVHVQPSPECIRIIQDKYLQKLHFKKHNIPLPDFIEVTDMESLDDAATVLGYPLMIKSRRLAYDGRGNAIAASRGELLSAVSSLGGFERGLYVEKCVTFEKELAVMVVRGRNGELRSYSVVETTQKGNICHTVQAPARVSWRTKKASKDLAERAVLSLGDAAGVFGVELFLLPDGQLLLNEVAPRPHNSGHYTIEACYTSQFEQHVRAVLGLPLGDTAMKVSAAVMYNLLGMDEGEVGMRIALQDLSKAWSVPGASVHWYDKSECRRQRKMGHITVVGPSQDVVRARLDEIMTSSDENRISDKVASVGIIMGSDSDLPVMKDAVELLESCGVVCEVNIVSAHRTAHWMFEYARTAHSKGLKVIIAGAGGAAHLPGMAGSLTPLGVIGVPVKSKALGGADALLSIIQMPRGVPVATVDIDDAGNAGLIALRLLALSDKLLLQNVVARIDERSFERLEAFEKKHAQAMGSEEESADVSPVVGIIESSLAESPALTNAAQVLGSFGVAYERVRLSAEYVRNAHTKGIKAMIVAPELAADLPGLVSNVTPLPVIGIASSSLDSLISCVSRSSVAWVGIGNGTNAGLLAVRFLASLDSNLLVKMRSYQEEMETSVLNKAERLQEVGWKTYLAQVTAYESNGA